MAVDFIRWLRLGRAWGVLALAAALGLGTWPAHAAEAPARRLALVIGNSGYETSPLTNSVNDARAMAQALRDAGFTVLLHTDADQRQMQQALREFGERLKLGGTGLFYFAGHGMQIKGRNYLIPVRSDISHEDEVAYTSLDAQAVLDKMESAGNGTNIVILDACRNNPFARSFRSAQQGLAQMDAPAGSMVIFATAPGSVAIDNLPGYRNGLFTTHLLESMRKPGLKLEDVLKQSRLAVLRASGNKQMPWESSALVGDFYFHPPVPAASASPPPAAAPVDTQAAIDDALWEVVKDSRSSAEIYAYLNRFPNGRHARQARLRLLDLAAPPPPATPAPAAAATPAAPEGEVWGVPQWQASRARLRSEFDAVMAAGRRADEAIATWGDRAAAELKRPESPRRNGPGFAEGDRFRYYANDAEHPGYSRSYVWRIDRIEPDGSLWINGGRQRLDAIGQRRGGNDELNGSWLEFDPPLPTIEAAQGGPGRSGSFSTTASERDAQGRLIRHRLTGTWQTSIDPVRLPRHFSDIVHAVRVHIELKGEMQRGDGMWTPSWMQVRSWWMNELLLPIAIEIDEIEDGLVRRREQHQLVAVDLLGAPRP